jgi:gamma-glutamylcyclotransferase (GGCT)/AIG2-like uncharacterized protein YtfP
VEPSFLFVYGTLRRGCPNQFARLLNAHARFVGIGRMRGRLYQVAAYPGAIQSEAADEWVRGEIFELQDPDILATLDGFEGGEFNRAVVHAELDGGQAVESWCYLFNREPRGHRIESGDWGSH